ncbi:TIGR00341 family protein [Methanococcus voltae]|uniref:TIGR00341 family protein n=1 Tax=Methanococcus voltae (strain ATCC BAA-1334 / A3) TaxID=456320 RepID=D7DTK0_METV3|nr:TIGR00341 family protein [Methanococcus voltae]MCS3901312.1 putative hydrophobic protein (TIGR00341 family) [Methanococcus voltae]
MKLRLIECYVPKGIFAGLESSVSEESLDKIIWSSVNEERNQTVIKILTTLSCAESITDELSTAYGGSNFRIFTLSPTSTYPRLLEEEKEESNETNNEDKKEKLTERFTRGEILSKMEDFSKITKEYILMLILSAIVASIGLWKNDVAIIIASMIIAPLLGPNIALSFSVSVADFELAKKSLKNLILGVSLVLIFSIFLGHIIPITPEYPQIASRMDLGLYNVLIALSAGIIGTLSVLISGISSSVVGVMIAVALIPPLVAFGLMLGAGYYLEALPIMILFIMNIVAVNFCSVLLFFVYGITPYKWWEKEKAKTFTIFTLIFWLLALLFMAGIIIYRENIINLFV